MKRRSIISAVGVAAAVFGCAIPTATAADVDNSSATSQSGGVTTDGVQCNPSTTYTYSDRGLTWVGSDSGTVVNNSGGTVRKSIGHTKDASFTSTKSGDVGLSIQGAIAGANAQFGWSTQTTYGYSKSTTFEIEVPPRTTVKFQDGVVKRLVAVKQHTLYSNCGSKDSTGSFYLAEHYSVTN